MIRRILCLPLVHILLLWTWTGCASGRSDRLAAYDDLPYQETFTYAATPSDITHALSNVMHSRAGSVTMIDHETGIVTAELQTADLLPEEEHAAAESDDESLATIIFAGIVAAFLFIVLFGWLGDGCGDDDDKEEDVRSRGSRRPERIPDRDHDGIEIYVDTDDDVVRGYRYIFTFTLREAGRERTSVLIRTLRQESENGVIVRAYAIQNAHLNYSLNDALRADLARP